ncbi:MAG: hypothetical protein LiPW15_125 [Parcubacteria group bacterium LiPW_15]|nr:MAG: hypothetical protein LiPW15_125 [Parcubacteria group bacterium LiPW_15]
MPVFESVTEKKKASSHLVLGLLAGILVLGFAAWLALNPAKNASDPKAPATATETAEPASK